MWGIVPAAGAGSRIQPLAFSKELLPVGSRVDGDGVERPKAVSEYLVERMIRAGATRICFVISPAKGDIVQYYGGGFGTADVCYAVQPRPAGLCALGDDTLSFLLFPVERPEFFDAVVTDADGRVLEIQVKQPGAATHWVWGAFKLPGWCFAQLHELWRERGKQDEYIGTLVNAWLARGGVARAVRAGQTYVDVGTLHGYREAIQALTGQAAPEGPTPLCALGTAIAAEHVPVVAGLPPA